MPIMEAGTVLSPRRGISVPFADYAGPLWFGAGCEKDVLELTKDFARTKGWNYLELRGGVPPQWRAKAAISFVSHSVRLAHDATAQFAQLSTSARQAVRKAERSGVRVESSRSETAVRRFYRLHCGTRRRHGSPPQPYCFFQHIAREIVAKGAGFVVLAYVGESAVAGAMFFEFGKMGLFKFGASQLESQEVRPNNLVMWTGIKALMASGCEVLHLGRTSLDNAGLRRFKLSLGAKEETLDYVRFEPQSGEWLNGVDRAAGGHAKFFRLLPMAVNRLAGMLIYPHLD